MLDFDIDEKAVVLERNYQIPLHPSDRKGFSEKRIRERLEDKGWMVWRGGFLHATRKREVYPNVEKKYKKLNRLVNGLELLQYICVVHHGMPDFLCYKSGTLKFIECKLGYESLSERQRKTIAYLLKHGYKIEIHRIVEHQTKRDVSKLNIATNEREIVKEQEKIGSYV